MTTPRRSSRSPAVNTWTRRLQAWLTTLDPAGEDGFEGVVREVLQAVTGAGFWLNKSGPQGGTDGRGRLGNSLDVAFEAKRYRPGTRLPLDQLKAKLVDAASQAEPPDLWILAATRPVPADDRAALDVLGRTLGLGVMILDWDAAAALPDMALLCACAPDVLERRGFVADGVAPPIADAGFEAERARMLERLSRADIGFGVTQATVARWLDEAQASEPNALSRLKGFNNLRHPDVTVAARPALFAKLSDWWDARGQSAVLLGDEGVGKTWAALSWLEHRRVTTQDAPLTLFLSARDIGDGPVETVIARSLARQAGWGDEVFWGRRLALWRRGLATEQRLLLIVDGLNQNWLKSDWAMFLQPLFEDGWRGRFGVLMTCWPSTWTALGELAPLTPAPAPIEVPVFDDEELDAFLDGHGYSSKDFSTEMLSLIRVPRLSLLALQSRQRLEASGDVTPERLAYEDWMHRIRRGSAGPRMTDTDFQEFVTDLGQEYGGAIDGLTLSRRDLLERLGRTNGEETQHLSATLADLVAGRWFEPAGRPQHFRLARSLTPYALGLTLAWALRDLTDETSASARIAEFLDPFKGQSLGVAILRAAATLVLIDRNSTRPIRRAIVSRWLSEQNFGQADFQAWWRILGADTALFLDLAESWWLDRKGDGSLFLDEVLIKGFSNARKFEEVGRLLEHRVTQWLGWGWIDTEATRFFINPARLNDVHSARAAWDAWSGAAEWPTIELRESGDVSWLAARALGILSFGPVAAFSHSLTAWALSRTIMGYAEHFDEVAWLLRLNTEDVDETGLVVRAQVERLISTGRADCAQAATWLLQALGTEADQRRADALTQTFPSIEKAESDRVETNRLGACDPANIGRHPAKDIRPSDLWAGNEDHQQRALIAFEEQRSGVARTAPKALGDLLRAVARSAAERDRSAMSGLVAALKSIVFVLGVEDRLTASAAILRLLEEDGPTDPKERLRWRSAALLLRLFGRDAQTQFELLTTEGFEPALVVRLRKVITGVPETLRDQMIASLPQPDTRQAIQGLLNYLHQSRLSDEVRTWDALTLWVTYPDFEVRVMALRVATLSRHPEALRAFYDSDWRVHPKMERSERAYGSVALYTASEVIGVEPPADRIDADSWGWRLLDKPKDERALGELHGLLRREVEAYDVKGSRTLPQFSWDLTDPVKSLLEHQGDQVLAWFKPWLAEHTSIPALLFSDAFPLTTLCIALFTTHPEVAGELWTKIRHSERDGLRRGGSVFLPLHAEDLSALPEIEAQVLAALTTDDTLRGLARQALTLNRSAWLANLIERDVSSTEPVRIARGWRLLGFCDDVLPFSGLWHDLPRPQCGWLAEVVADSWTLFEQNRWARHWYAVYADAEDVDVAYAAYVLLEEVIDDRANLWLVKAFKNAPLKGERLYHWNNNSAGIDTKIKERCRRFESTLFGLKTRACTQGPWL